MFGDSTVDTGWYNFRPSGDGRLICPIDKPTVAKVSFDWGEITQDAMSHNFDLRRQKWRVKQRELEYQATDAGVEVTA